MTTGTLNRYCTSRVLCRYPDGSSSVSLVVGTDSLISWAGSDATAAERASRVIRLRKPESVPWIDWRSMPRKTPEQRRARNKARARASKLKELRDAQRADRAKRLELLSQIAKHRRWLKRSLPPHSYTKTIRRQFLGYVAISPSSTGSWNTAGVYNTSPAVLAHVPLVPQDHYKLIEKLRRLVYGSGFHPGVFAAEFPKAASMIFDAATRLRIGLISMLLGNWRGMVRALQLNNYGKTTGQLAGIRNKYIDLLEGRMTVSRFWLEIQYGWMPLVGDLEEGGRYLAYALSNASQNDRSVRARRKLEKSATDVVASSRVDLAHRVTTYKLQYVITNLRAEAPFVPSLAGAAGVAWEVLPYSFVVDWVAPIGSYLQALRTAHDIKGTVVFSTFARTVWSEVTAGNAVKRWQWISPLPSTCELVDISRTVSDEITPPTPLGDLSPSSIFSCWQRAVNAVALLQNLKLPEDSEWAKRAPPGVRRVL